MNKRVNLENFDKEACSDSKMVRKSIVAPLIYMRTAVDLEMKSRTKDPLITHHSRNKFTVMKANVSLFLLEDCSFIVPSFSGRENRAVALCA